MFSIDKLAKLDKDIFEKRKLTVGVICLFLGVYLVIENIMSILEPYISYELRRFIIYDLMRDIPKVIIGVAIVTLGIKLIKGKKWRVR